MNNPGGGAERVLSDVARGLVGRGHKVAVLTFDLPGGHSFYPLHPQISRIELGIGSVTDSARVLISIRRILALRKSVQAYVPDVVIGFMHSMFIPLGFSLVGTSIPMIASEHIVPEHYRSRPMEALLLYLPLFLAKRLTCVSEQVLHLYPRLLRSKMVAIANPVSVGDRERADVVGSPRSRKVLLSVGRLEPQKDYATLIQAFANIANRVPNWVLRIVGEGKSRSQLETQVAELGLDGRVELPGATKDIMLEYLAAQLFVLSSRYESFGLVIAEALVHGLPAVGFADCAGVNQLIRSGENGVLVDVVDDRVAALATVLEEMMLDDDTRIALAQKFDGLPAEYSLDNVIKRWEEIIEQVTR